MLNRAKVIEIVKNLISIKIKDDKIENIVEYLSEIKNNIDYIDDAESPVIEADLILLLLSNFKFYDLSKTVATLIENLNEIGGLSEYKNLKCICTIISGYLYELFTKVSKLELTELDAHLNVILRYFYQNSHCSLEMFERIMDEYLFDKRVLSGTPVISSKSYSQLSFVADEEEDLQDKVSYYRYDRRTKIERDNKRIVTKYYNLDDLKKLRENL